MLVEAATRIHFSDDAIIVAEKASGLLSVPGRGPDRQDCLSVRVQTQFADALIVHRLDMETSGLMLFARGIDSQRVLSRAFETREVSKRYVAVVAGVMDEDEGSVNLPLICDWPNRPRQMVDHELGKPSLTRYRVLARDTALHTTRVSLMPVTGRSHQLRVHMAARQHPMLGDSLYAPPGVQALSPRLLLHATELRFAHPVSGETLAFNSEAPF